MQGERAGTAGTRVLKYWERTEEGGDKASGDASACADLCDGVWVDQSEYFWLLWGRQLPLAQLWLSYCGCFPAPC